MLPLIRPDWHLDGVQAVSTTRQGGVSQADWASLNVGLRCGDDPAAVAENRRRVESLVSGPPHWLEQVHGTRVIHLDQWRPGIEADAAWTDRRGQVLAIQTADCLPLLLADRRARLVAAAHAGWRGLRAGIVPRLVGSLPLAAGELVAWIGPGIAQAAFEVGPEVRTAFLASGGEFAMHFVPGRGDRWLADLKAIATIQLKASGVGAVLDCGLCTYTAPERFFSYRRDRVCGRMVSMIWLV